MRIGKHIWNLEFLEFMARSTELSVWHEGLAKHIQIHIEPIRQLATDGHDEEPWFTGFVEVDVDDYDLELSDNIIDDKGYMLLKSIRHISKDERKDNKT